MSGTAALHSSRRKRMNAAPAAANRQRDSDFGEARSSDFAVCCLLSAGMPRLPLCTATEAYVYMVACSLVAATKE